MYAPIIQEDLKRVVKGLGFTDVDIVLSIPENEGFGDYSSNVALQLAKQNTKKSYQSANEIANQIVDKLGHPDYFERIEVAGPGFINFYLNPKSLTRLLQIDRLKKAQDEKILIEYGQPNTHKPLHIGHFRTLFIGESLARILEDQGYQIFRVSYGSDIGPTVAKALWGVDHLKDEYQKIKLNSTLVEKADFLGRAYAMGHKSYTEDPEAKIAIDKLTIELYKRDPNILPIWEETKKWSMAYFDSVYSSLGTEFDAIIGESEIEQLGRDLVAQNIGKVFIQDQGAIIFPGESYGLHTRVFITSAGNPTYEAKELGITYRYQELFPADYSLHVVDSQQIGFFQVVTKALELIDDKIKGRKRHISYGFVALSSGKMSSRNGNVITADSLVNQIKDEIKASFPESTSISNPAILDKITFAAIKFFYLKFNLNSDIVFNIKESISLEGDTGPYVIYTYARIQSLLAKLKPTPKSSLPTTIPTGPSGYQPEPEERALLRHLEHFDQAVERAAQSYQPNEIASYLLSLAHSYNVFYQKFPIIKSEHQDFRAAISNKVGHTIKEGLYLLGIEAPERM